MRHPKYRSKGRTDLSINDPQRYALGEDGRPPFKARKLEITSFELIRFAAG